MKSAFKVILAGIIIAVIGAVILIVTLAVNDWSVKQKFTMQTYTAQDDNSAIEIDIGASILRCEFFDGDRIEISYPQSKSFTTEIKERDGRLTFENGYKKWYFSFSGFTTPPETVIKMPSGKTFDLDVHVGAGTVDIASGIYGKVKIHVSAGKLTANSVTCNALDIDVSAGTLNAAGVTCNTADIDVSAGTVNLSSLSCPDITADISAGKINLGILGVKSEYTIRTEVSAGSCNVSNQGGNGGKRLNIDCSAGSVTVNFSE